MDRAKIIKQITEYILNLPNKTKTTLHEVALAVGIKEFQEADNPACYGLLEEIARAADYAGVVMDFSVHDGLVEGLPFHMDFIVRKKRLQKAQIVSDLMVFGPCREPQDVIEQRLTISSCGRIWFTEYLFGEIGSTIHPMGRKIQMSIGKEKAAVILSLIADYCENSREW